MLNILFWGFIHSSFLQFNFYSLYLYAYLFFFWGIHWFIFKRNTKPLKIKLYKLLHVVVNTLKEANLI